MFLVGGEILTNTMLIKTVGKEIITSLSNRFSTQV